MTKLNHKFEKYRDSDLSKKKNADQSIRVKHSLIAIGDDVFVKNVKKNNKMCTRCRYMCIV